MGDKHYATFKWGAGPQSVHVAGGFNEWSDSATPLHKQPDGSFSGEVPMPWGAKQSFKYVVDGDWKVREDEAKEWDAAGNMNNVYTAPPAPLAAASSDPAPAPAPAAAATSEPEPAAPVDKGPTEVPPASAPDAAPAAVESKTEPATLVAAAAPRQPFELGAVAGGGAVPPTAPPSVNPAAVATAGPAATPAATGAAAEPEPQTQAELIEKTAKGANVGEASAVDKSVYERAAEVGGVALAGLGAVAGTAAVVVEKVTGVDLTHTSPLTVEEAKAKGIDINSLEKVEAPTDAITKAPSAPAAPPPASAVAALEEKIQELKVDTGAGAATGVADSTRAEQVAVPLPNGSAPKSSVAPGLTQPKPATDDAPSPDIPGQADTRDNHRSVPATVITPVSARDPAKDRSLDAPSDRDTAGNTAVSSAPGASAADAKRDAAADPAHTHPAAMGAHTTELDAAPAPVPKSAKPNADLPGSGSAEPAVFTQSAVTPVTPPVAAAGGAGTQPTPTGPATPAKAAPGSAASTPGHARDSTGSTTGDVKKRKSGFFGKIKHAFSPAKEKK